MAITVLPGRVFWVLKFEGAELSTELAANARGNRGQVTMEIVESESQLKTALNISAKADLSFKMGLWNSNNSIKAEYDAEYGIQ